jgi:hypothetical protein
MRCHLDSFRAALVACPTCHKVLGVGGLAAPSGMRPERRLGLANEGCRAKRNLGVLLTVLAVRLLLGRAGRFNIRLVRRRRRVRRA